MNEGQRPHLGYGIGKAAEFYSLPLRKTYYLAAKGALPGVFKLDGSREWVIDFAAAREGLTKKSQRKS